MLNTNSKDKLLRLTKQNPFNYDLGIKIVACNKSGSDITICCPGYGANSSLANTINSYNIFSGHIISFNFPDYNITSEVDHNNSAYGTSREIIPLIYILKQCICDLKIKRVNLYGFSAGGGAIINLLSDLTSTKHDTDLKSFAISSENKKEILSALQKSFIILDCPLKSVREIIAFREASKELVIMEKHYSENNMEPINVLDKLTGINLTIFLNFENPDEILSNHDDKLFIDKLENANQGKTIISISSNEGHCGYHTELWKNIKKWIK